MCVRVHTLFICCDARTARERVRSVLLLAHHSNAVEASGAPDAGQVITGGNGKHIGEAAVGKPGNGAVRGEEARRGEVPRASRRASSPTRRAGSRSCACTSAPARRARRR
jgi:hypothetical protein